MSMSAVGSNQKVRYKTATGEAARSLSPNDRFYIVINEASLAHSKRDGWTQR
jgi:hypothetical protein